MISSLIYPRRCPVCSDIVYPKDKYCCDRCKNVFKKIEEPRCLKCSRPVENEVIKSLSYDIKPISVEDAKLKLEERKGNIFYTFVNVDTGKVNVIFKLKDSNNYGLVEPEA